MKKLIAALLAVVAVAGAAGWYRFVRPHDRLALARHLMANGDARGAELELRNAVLTDPNNAEAHFRLAEVQLRLGDPYAAEKELVTAREHGWDPHRITPPLTEAILDQGRFQEVLKTNLDGLDPAQQAAVLVSQAEADLALHKDDAARTAAADAQRLAPRSLEAATAVARVARASGDAAGAEKAIALALAINPHAPEALLMRADALAAKGDIVGAIAACDDAVVAAPDSPMPRVRRAELLLDKGDDARAKADIAATLDKFPHSPAALFLQAELDVRSKDYKGADAALQQLGPVLSQLPRGEFLQALVKANLNQPEQAADAATRYLTHAPDDQAGYKLLGQIDLAARRPVEAVDVLNRAVGAGHADSEMLQMLAEAYAQTGAAAQAVQTMQQAIALAPGDTRLLSRLAALRLRTGDPIEAAHDLQHLLEVLPVAATPSVTTSTPATATSSSSSDDQSPTAAQTAAALVIASLQSGNSDQAASALDRLRKSGANPRLVLELDGLIKLARVDLDGARTDFEKAIKSNPEDPAPRLDFARVLELQGKSAQAEMQLEQAVAADKANVAAVGSLVALYLSEDKTDQALAVLQSAHQAFPANPVLVVALADMHTRTKQPQKALELLAPTLNAAQNNSLAPDRATNQSAAFLLLGARERAQLALGQHREASETMREMLALQPANLQLRIQLAKELAEAGNVADAKAMLHEGLASQPGNLPLLQADVQIAAKAGGIQAGLARADELERDAANLPAARMLKGDLYAAEKKFPEAVAAYKSELKDDSSVGLVVRLALAQRAAGNPDEAAATLRNWLGKHPDSVEAQTALASFDLTAHRLDVAKQELNALLAKQPSDATTLNNLAWIAQQQNDLPQARQLAQRAWMLSSTPQSADTLGWIVLAQGQTATALDLLRTAANGMKDDPTIQYHYAVALKDAGQKPEAEAILTKLSNQPVAFDEQDDAKRLLQELTHP